MSFLDPYTAGDPNPDELNPFFMHLCIAGIAVSAIAWLLLDNLMLHLVLAAVIIGLVTAIGVRGVQQVDPDATAATDRHGRANDAAPAPPVNQPLVRMPTSLRARPTSRES